MLALVGAMGLAAGPAVADDGIAGLRQIGADPLSDPAGQHRTQVEPDSFSNGRQVVAAVQTGRVFNGGATGIAWAASDKRGDHWERGVVPGLTTATGGPYAAVSDPAVAYDRRHRTWLISSLPLNSTPAGVAVLVSRSRDAEHWGGPVTVAAATGRSDLDKNWIVCDNHRLSQFYGHCYAQWDDFGAVDLIQMSTSTDGGRTWSAPRATAARDLGLGGQPLVAPNGTVIVPISDIAQVNILAFRSTDGGASWTAATRVASAPSHRAAGPLRTSVLPSAEVDATGRVYVAWQDCRFRAGCSANDIVISSSADGVAWTAPLRVPIDAPTSPADHFIPGLAVDPDARGRLALAYYFYPQANCTLATCKLDVGFISSTDGGATWSAPRPLAGPMSLSWLAATSQGYMVGDYISTSFLRGRAVPVLEVARPPRDGRFDEATFSASIPLGRDQERAASASPSVPQAGRRARTPAF